MEVNIKIVNDSAFVTVQVTPAKPGQPKLRVYMHDALRMLKEKHPKLKIGKCVNNCVVRSLGPQEGTWEFKILQEEKPQPKVEPKKSAKKTTKKRAVKKEVISDAVEDSDRTS